MSGARTRHGGAPATAGAMPPITIPFNRLALTGREHAYIDEAVRNWHISGDGPFTHRCQAWLEERLDAPCCLLTTSCTHALEMAALLLGVGPGDEVIVPSFTFVSTANAFALRGARPVFCDVRPDTLNLDEERLSGLITERTRAIVPVHYAGVACEMDAIGHLAARHGIPVVEDAAHGLFGAYHGRPLGSLGAMATLSFHETKNVSCGEGGALVLNDRRLVERAEIVREKGTNRARFHRGEVDRYTWEDLGSSWLPSDILAAFLWAQLEQSAAIQAARRALWDRYAAGLADWAVRVGAEMAATPEGCEQAYHLFRLMMPSEEARDGLIAHLRKQGILAVFHYLPLHLSPMGRRFGGRPGDCPVAESASARLVRLPFYSAMTDDEQARVIEAVRAYVP